MRVKSTINLAGFPAGQERDVDEKDARVASLLSSGKLIRVDEAAAASDAEEEEAAEEVEDGEETRPKRGRRST